MENFNAETMIEEFEAMSKDAVAVQEQALQRILEENGDAEYLQKLGLCGRTDYQSFKSCVPLATHKDLEPYIQRIADGDTSPVLTGKPIHKMSLSSGTTEGKQKYIPFNDHTLMSSLQTFKTSFAYRNREIPIGKGKALQLLYSSKQAKTRGGLTASTASTNVCGTEEYKNTVKVIQSPSTSPQEVMVGSDYRQSLYCHLLCALIFAEEVQMIFSTFAYSLLGAFRAFEDLYEEICSDIREGVLSKTRVTSPEMREAVSGLLRPNPELADEILRKCSGLDNWYGLIPALFPNAKYLYGIMTGSMEHYLAKLRHYAGDLPLMSADYGASEGWIGCNVLPKLPPELTTFALLPNISFYEFIPVENPDYHHSSNGEVAEEVTVLIGDLKVGEEYEIVLTSFAGLYRYRLGDIVKITGFYNNTPLLQFKRRKALLLNINIDKNTEKDLQLAVEEAGKLLTSEKLEVLDFTSHSDMSTDPGHYIIYWELNGDPSDNSLLFRCADAMDKAFVDPGYVSSRKTNSIGDLELRVLKKGTFQKMLEHYLRMGAAVSQFKTPRCVGSNNAEVLQILNDNVAGSYFSCGF